MRFRIASIALVLSLRTASAAEYKPDWKPEDFYREVETCRIAIVLPAIKAFVDKGVARKNPEEEVRTAAISMLPLMEHAATGACFCAVNETAKTVDYKTYFGDGDFTDRTRQLSKLLYGPPCDTKLKEAMAEMEDPKAREAMQLH
jgi:hypothetical protein